LSNTVSILENTVPPGSLIHGGTGVLRMLTVFDEGGRLAAKLKRSELPELQKLDGDKTEKM
jgi:hypothetical protein